MTRIQLRNKQIVVRTDNIESVVSGCYNIKITNVEGRVQVIDYDSTQCTQLREDYYWILDNMGEVIKYGIE